MYGIESADMYPVGRIFLDEENPRHEPFESQQEIIDYLCKEEQVLQIAKDIVAHGLNPLELFALLRVDKKSKKLSNSYVVAEGNRRLCAMMLLNDPELAPAEQRSEFAKVAESWTPIKKVFAVVFDDRDQVRLWLDRIHAGVSGGVGRRQWNPEQKARNSGYKKNALAVAVLDSAEERGLISAEQRKGRVSTVQRYLSNPLMRDALGIDNGNLEDVTTFRTDREFENLLGHFISDVTSRKIHTRDNEKEITKYSNDLRRIEGVSGRVAPPTSISKQATTTPKRKRIRKPKKPKEHIRIPYSSEVHSALEDIPSYKLEKLYYSICTIDLDDHTPLLAVGMWAFLESLSARAGKNELTSFEAFLTPDLLSKFGLGNKRQTKAVREAISRIAEYGNTTKHHKGSAAFNGEQLANDAETLTEVFLKLAELARE